MIKVTESDRRAVRAFQKASARYIHRVITDVSFGSALGEQQDDTHPIYQAFATHRQQAAKAERDRLRERLLALPPSIYDGPDQYVRKADVLAAFQQENSDD